ncbi:triacylglycerol lipase OBL1-like [Euphorbia lathyris]|uniref:triacylglycerol lipase OBL1-like n=1 Tax=Euphorbia lathyris TaxID=212925 RepID=UPI003313449F
MDCNKAFSSNYLILKKEEVKFFDLISILFSSDLGKRKFIESAEAIEESFERRLLIFISIVTQKMLQFFSTPLLLIGSLIQIVLNLLNLNGNSILRLFLNLLTGKLKIPNKTSEEFISFIGNLDMRKDLDKNINRGDARYEAALCMMASKAAYENQAYVKNIVNDYWKMEFLGFYDFWNDYEDKMTTQAFIFRDKTEENETIIVAFKGTETFNADSWCSDFDVTWYELQNIGRIHGGFMKALGLQKSIGWPKEEPEQVNQKAPLAYYRIREILRELLSKNEKAKFVVTGHSLGGALAILFPAVLAIHDEKILLEKLSGVYTFGQPRVGDGDFAKYMENKLRENEILYYRFVYCNDMIARVPFDDSALMFKHFGTCVYFDRHYQSKVVEEEPNKNYFSPVGGMGMMINALMELMRSLTINYSKGEEYKEGMLMKIFRLIGIVIPGLPSHCPQDYVNATRLGSPNAFLPISTLPPHDLQDYVNQTQLESPKAFFPISTADSQNTYRLCFRVNHYSI